MRPARDMLPRIAALVCLAWTALRAAQPYTEPFSGSLSGWTGAVQEMNATVSASNGAARVYFPYNGFPGFPAPSVLIAGSSASAGAFVGNYGTAGVRVIGFDFRADQAIPERLQIEFSDAANGYIRYLETNVVATGVWHRFHVSLDSAAAGDWKGNATSQVFEATRSAITGIVIRVQRSGSVAQTYLIDNVFVDYAPAAGSLTTAGADLTAEWIHLRTGVNYRVEAAQSLLLQDWAPVTNVTPSATSLSLTLPISTNDQRFLRLRSP